MNQHESLTSLMIVLGIAFFIPILLHKLKLRIIPVVVAEIIAGIVIGKSGFNLISDGTWLDILSLLGLIYLMFLSGVEIDFNSFQSTHSHKKGAIQPFKVAIILFAAIMGLSFILSLGLQQLGLIHEPFLMTLIIATISLGVVVPVLKEQKLLNTDEGQTALLITVLSDFITMILLTVYLSMQSNNTMKLVLLLIFFMVVFFVYRFIKRFLKGRIFNVLSKGTIQIGTRGVFALILLFVVLSENFGAESILGAFLAGVIVSLLSPEKEFVHQLDSFGYGFLIPIFFVMVGVKLQLWELISDPTILILLPLMLVAMYVAKMIPLLWLRKWFGWRQVFGLGILLSSKLSLAIAAATVALELGFIDSKLQGALILVSVLTCLISPITFSKIFPKKQNKKPSVSIIGVNSLTIPVACDLINEGFEVQYYESPVEKDMEQQIKPGVTVTRLNGIDEQSLEDQGVFNTDMVIFGSNDENFNIELSQHSLALGQKKNIVRVDQPELHKALSEKGFLLFSTLHASQTMLKAMVEHPSSVRLITQHNEAIHEVEVNNPTYDGIILRSLPHLDNTLILRIYRGHSDIIPHGNTMIQSGDRLLVSGNAESIQKMKLALE